MKCWGQNTYGQLGDGTTTNQYLPVDVSGLTSGISAVTSGATDTCALTVTGGVKCWGENDFGKLGDGSTTDQDMPVDVIGLSSGVTAIANGSVSTCALQNGAVKCWGSNVDGQLGDGTITNRYTPVDVKGLPSGIRAIAVGQGDFACALTAAGGVMCWGSNEDFGELGDGTTTDHHIPMDVSGLTSGVISITAGVFHACALTVAGGVKCWGYNADGELGDGTTTDQYIPVDVTGLTGNIVAIRAGYFQTCALTAAGGVECWGRNDIGQLGNGSTTQSNTPVDVSGLTSGVSGIAAGINSCARMTDGSIKCWGDNEYGTLGNGTTTSSTIPVDVVSTDEILSGNAGVNGATLNYTLGTSEVAAFADSNGNYSFAVPDEWSGTVTPSETGYSFVPVNHVYSNVTSDQAVQDFTALVLPGSFNKSAPINNLTNASLLPTLSWTTSSAATSYEYCIDTINNNTCDTSWTSTGVNTSVDLPVLSSNTTYYWQVHAINTGGTIDADNGTWWSFTTGIPGGFNKSGLTNAAINQSVNPTLSWTSSNGASSYEYCYDTTNDNVCASWISNGTSTNANLGGLLPNTTYYWQVRAVNGTGQTYADASATAFWSFKTMALPVAFNKNSPANNSLKQLTNPILKWAASTAASSYQVCYDTINNNICDTSWISVPSTTVTPSNLSNNTIYYWQVRAVNLGGVTYANVGVWWSFKVVLAPPSLLSPANDSTNSVHTTYPTFTWSDPNTSGVTGYTIQIARNSTFTSGLVAGTSVTASYTTSTALSPNKIYYWRVEVKGTNGPSLWSSPVWSFLTGNPASVPVLSAPASNTLYTNINLTPTFTWKLSALPITTPITTFGYYEIQIATDAAFSNVVKDDINNTSLHSPQFIPAPSVLNFNTTYYWHVRAYTSTGDFSGWSKTWTLRTVLQAPTLTSPNGTISNSTLRPTFTWTDPNTSGVTGVTGYTIQISKINTFTSVLVTGSTIATAKTRKPLRLPLTCRRAFCSFGTLRLRVSMGLRPGLPICHSPFNKQIPKSILSPLIMAAKRLKWGSCVL